MRSGCAPYHRPSHLPLLRRPHSLEPPSPGTTGFCVWELSTVHGNVWHARGVAKRLPCMGSSTRGTWHASGALVSAAPVLMC